MILLVNQTTLVSMGQAGFFAAIIAVMLPPFLPFSLYAFLILTLAVGMFLGWAWGCAAMAAGLSVRDVTLLAQQQADAQAALVGDVPVVSQMQVFIFHGRFLDPRSSAVFGAFLFIGAYFFGLLRAHYPSLTITAIFGTIVLDVMCSFGPLFFSPQYTIASMFLLPTAYYVAIALVSLAIIFPESVNHVWLFNLKENVITPVQKMINLQQRMFEVDLGSLEAWSELQTVSQAISQELVAGVQALLPQVSFAALEVSIGTLSPADLTVVSKHLTILSSRTTGLSAFLQTVHGGMMTESRSRSNDRQTLLRQRIREKELRHQHDLSTLLPILSSASTGLRAQCLKSTDTLLEWFNECNSKRWTNFMKKLNTAHAEDRHAKLTTCLENLEKALSEFKEQERAQLLQPYERFFLPETGRLPEDLINDPTNPEMFTARTLLLCFMFADTLVAFTEEIASLLRTAIELDSKRRKPRIWFPVSFSKRARKAAQGRKDEPDPLSMGNTKDLTSFKERNASVSSDESDATKAPKQKKGKDPRKYQTPDALPPKSALDWFFVHFAAFCRYLRSPESVFGLRHAIVSIALWVPSVCASTAWFAYDNKALWALIMAQVSLAVYAGEQIASFLLRVAGTVIGLLLGMAAWYMGSGHGDGNPYGVVIATSALVAPFMFLRLCSPPQYTAFWLLTGVTIVFVTGYSWIDTHLTSQMVSNSGVGVELGWKRALLVLIGFTAGFIVMLFPRPSTSRVLVRKTLAASIDEFASLIVSELEVFLLEHESHLGNLKSERQSMKSHEVMGTSEARKNRTEALGMKLMDASTRLTALAPSLMTAKFEPGLRGKWPGELYNKLYANQNALVFYMGLLGTTLARLDPNWCDVLVHQTPFLNPSLLSELLSTLAILSSSLANGLSIPGSLPSIGDRLIYHHRMVHYQQKQLLPGGSNTRGPQPGEEGLDSIDTTHVGLFEVTLSVLADDQLPIHSTAVIALANIFRLTDECGAIIKELCGETTFAGFESLREEYLKREEAATLGHHARPSEKQS